MISARKIFIFLLLPVMLLLTQCQTPGDIATRDRNSAAQNQSIKDRTDRDFVDFLDSYVDYSTKRYNFSGIILFARGYSILFHRAYGLADRSRNVPVGNETRFNLASASKMFTAVAIAKLKEEGKLSYDDPIGNYLGTGWVSEEVGARVQIRHLLNHTSGLGHYWDEYDSYKDKLVSLDDYQILISDELAFAPGSAYQYSNSGYILLGVIIEKITGKNFYKYVQDVIFSPCGMLDAGFFRMDEPHRNLAIGYFEDEEKGGKLFDNKMLHGIRGSSAGGAWSTATDLLRFFLALRSDELVCAETRGVLWMPKPKSPQYGYGFQIKDGWIGHWGGYPGIEAFTFYFPGSDRTFIVLSNHYDSALPLIGKMDRWYRRLSRE